MIPPKTEELIARYNLAPHPEGGWYREFHRSDVSVGILPGYAGERTALTAIYFLLAKGDFSAFHRVLGEEVWVHLAGDPLELVLLDKEPRSITLAPAGSGEPVAPVAIVPPNVLQAARTTGDYTLVTCLVAPGFDFADFSMPSREELLREYPGCGEVIKVFTRETSEGGLV
ncbi:MAG: cupin domain-containing protein [Nitrospirota bacterium]|nr:cupin domain-containing protein [Nitrospirota bacterium]